MGLVASWKRARPLICGSASSTHRYDRNLRSRQDKAEGTGGDKQTNVLLYLQSHPLYGLVRQDSVQWQQNRAEIWVHAKTQLAGQCRVLAMGTHREHVYQLSNE